MIPNLDKIVGTVLGITMLGLILRNAGAFNSIMQIGGGVALQNLALLQGNDPATLTALRGY